MNAITYTRIVGAAHRHIGMGRHPSKGRYTFNKDKIRLSLSGAAFVEYRDIFQRYVVDSRDDGSSRQLLEIEA